MSKKLGGILVLIVGAGLMLYSMARTFHLLSATLPAGQEILAAVALLGFDLGLVAWLIVFLKGAEGGLQRSIAALMIVIDLIAVISGFLGDTLLVSGQSGLLQAMDQNSRQTIVLVTAMAIAANIAAVIFYHMSSPENLRRMTEEAARDKIQSQALSAISQQANLLAEQLAPVIAADWVENMRADFTASLTNREDVKQLASAKPDEKARGFFKRPAAVTGDNLQTMATDGEAVTVGDDEMKKRRGWPLPKNWFTTMTDDEKTAWSLEHHLHEKFPDFTFKVTMKPFNVRVNEDGADVKAVQAETQRWFDMADGTKIIWGTPVHVEAETGEAIATEMVTAVAAKRGRPAKKS